MIDRYLQEARALALLNSDRPAVNTKLRSLADEVERLRARESGMPAGEIALLDEVEKLQCDVMWLETPMRARHKALLAAAEEVISSSTGWGKRPPDFKSYTEAMDLLIKAIADCKRDGPQ